MFRRGGGADGGVVAAAGRDRQWGMMSEVEMELKKVRV